MSNNTPAAGHQLVLLVICGLEVYQINSTSLPDSGAVVFGWVAANLTEVGVGEGLLRIRVLISFRLRRFLCAALGSVLGC